jgi:ABC-type multidrug transport system permease subunit
MIAQQQGLTVAAVIHSPSPDVFRQFDDLLLLGKGGQVVYMGPRISSLKYFDEIGFRCPDYTSPPDYFLEVLSGNIPSEFDPRFEPGMLVDYWKKFQCGIIPTSTFARMDKVQAERNRTQYFNRVLSVKHKRVIERQGEEKFFQYFQDGLAMIYAEIMLWLGDIMENHIFSISKHDDQTRKTPGFVRQLCLLTKRASDQIYRDSKIILFEMMLHFATGIFISVAVHNFDFLGASPDDLCATAPWNVARSCYHAVDNIKEAGMFIALGCFFAGISVGVNTFGREKVVYLRDSSSGMSALCYYLAKIIADIPRILIGAGTFSLALILYFPYRQNFISIVYVVLSLYIAAFSMSYLVSIIASQRSTPLVGTAVSLFYAIGLSGVIPSLDQVYGTDDPGVLDAPFVGFPYIIRLFWTFSPPRWAIEAFWLKEIQFRPFKEKYEQPTNQYRKESYNSTFIFIILISLMWNTFAFILLKSRRKQELSLKNI